MAPETVGERRLFAFMVTPFELFDYAQAIAFAREKVGERGEVMDFVESIALELKRLDEQGSRVPGIRWIDRGEGPDVEIDTRTAMADSQMSARLRVLATQEAMPVPHGGFAGLLLWALDYLADFGDEDLETMVRLALKSVHDDLENERGHMRTMLEKVEADA